MLIGIDGNEANIRERVGVNVWAFELLRALKIEIEKRDREKTEIVVYLSKSPLHDLPKESENWHYRVIPPAKFWTMWRLPFDLYFHRFKGSDLSGRSNPLRRPDVFLSLSHYAPKWVPPRGSTRRAPMPRVVSIMDLSFLKFPEAFKPAVLWQLKHWTEESVRHAAHVLTISEFNKKEIIKQYGYPQEKITVVYPGISEMFKGPTLSAQGRTFRSVRERYGIREKYLLFVGTLQPKKNLPRLIEAFSLIQKRFLDIQLVIAGKTWSQFASENQKFRKLLEVCETSSIQMIGYVPEEDLPTLMAGAEALVLPSLYEGFGIPAVEAMSVGTPVAVSNTTSLPEVVGDAGVLFDPSDVRAIASGVERVLLMTEKERQNVVEKGKIRAGEFSWERAAEKVMGILGETIKNARNC